MINFITDLIIAVFLSLAAVVVYILFLEFIFNIPTGTEQMVAVFISVLFILFINNSIYSK